MHSGYCKLNDYKGASCGQHSALSTQHSALSTQQVINKKAKFYSAGSNHFFALFLSFGLIFSASAQNKPNTNLVYVIGGVKAFCFPSENEEVFTNISSACNRVREYQSQGNGQPPTYLSVIDPISAPSEEELNPGNAGLFACYSSVIDYFGNIIFPRATCYGSVRPAQSSISLTLTAAPNQKDPHPDPRPASTKDKIPSSSTYELIAKVMEGSTPKAGVAVTFKVDVIEKTGGHGHHDASRPKGFVNGALTAGGVTEGNGEIKLTFQASIVAGSHNITATCDSCSNKTAVKKVDVLVPDLQPISANPPRNPDGTYLYALTSDDPTHVGTSGGRQRGEYYLTQTANDNLRGLLDQFAEEGWGVVGLNDASLNWGGVYDIQNNWSNPHMGHRLGEEIDISFVRAGNFIGKGKQNVFYDKFCQDKKGSVPFTILHHYQLRPHFHVYLTGKKQCGKTAI